MRNTINRLIQSLNMFLLCVLVVVVLWSTLARLLGTEPPLWAESSALVIMIWLGIVSISFSVANEEELKIGMLNSYFSDVTNRFLRDFFQLLTTLFAGYMIWYGLKLVVLANKIALGGTDFSNAWMYASIPICGILILLNIGKEK